MDRKAWVQVFLALGVGVPGLAQAMGLGDLIVLSGPGEPFRAEIPIRSEHPKELTGAQAGLAPASAFSLIHLPVDQTLSQWHFSVREGSQPAILISSPLPLTQASLPFLVQLDWSGGQIVREYRASSAAANTYEVPATRLAPPSSSPRPSARAMPYPPMPARPPRAEVAGWASAARYGPVPEHQTLFEIAQKLSRSNRVSLDQVMAALVRANPGAFKGGNPNMLYAGTYLRTPSLAQVQAMTPAQARAWLRAQAAGAAQARPTPAVASQTAPAGAASKAAPATRLVLSSAPSSVVAAAASSTAAMPMAAASTTSTAAAESATAALQSENAHLQTMLQALNTRLSQTQAQVASQATELAKLSQVSAQAHPGNNPLLWLSLGGNVLLLLLFLWMYQRQQEAARRQREVSQKLTMLAGNGNANGAGARSAPPPPAREEPAAFAPPPRTEPLSTSGVAGSSDVAARAPAPKGAVPETHPRVEPTLAATAAAAEAGMLAFEHEREPASSAPAAHGASDSGRTAAAETESSATADTGTDLSDPLQVDPLEQADLYLTYGKSDSAVTVLQEALEENPRRKELYVKLLDLYAQLDRRDAYLELAERMRGRFGPNNGAWQQVAAQGAQLFPGHSLFADAGSAPAPAPQPTAQTHEAFDVSAVASPAAGDRAAPAEAGADHLLDFNLDSLLSSADEEQDRASPQHEIPAAEKQRLLDSVNEQFRALDAESLAGPAEAPASAHFGLDFESEHAPADTAPSPTTVAQQATAESSGDWDAVGTKLDLAKAYLEMDDAESARELLEEVSREGNPQQRSEAHTLLESL
ncbi:MAG: FimV/HubP family polar landmark protein [Acidithiobacillus sp.]